MDTKMGPSYANLFVGFIEKQFLTLTSHRRSTQFLSKLNPLSTGRQFDLKLMKIMTVITSVRARLSGLILITRRFIFCLYEKL